MYNKRVCLRKTFIGDPPSADFRYKIYSRLGLNFYIEAAALNRLKGVKCVPQVREIYPETRTLIMDYIHGKTIRQLLAENTAKILDIGHLHGNDINYCLEFH